MFLKHIKGQFFFLGADDSGKNFLESVEEDFWIVDAPEVSSKELNLGVK